MSGHKSSPPELTSHGVVRPETDRQLPGVGREEADLPCSSVAPPGSTRSGPTSLRSPRRELARFPAPGAGLDGPLTDRPARPLSDRGATLCQLAPESEDASEEQREAAVAGPGRSRGPTLRPRARIKRARGAPRVRKPRSEDRGSARFAALRVCGCVWPEEAALPLVREPPRRAGRGVVVSLPHVRARGDRAGAGRGCARPGTAMKAARPHRAGTGRGSPDTAIRAVSGAGRRRCCRPSNGRSGSPSPSRAPPRGAAAP